MSTTDNTVNNKKTEVIITNIDMSFWNMICFMVKWALASIPAVIVTGVLYVFIVTTLMSLMGGH